MYKRQFKKLIQFNETQVENIYNLAFGDYDQQTHDIDDGVRTNNSDMVKVLATVAEAVHKFTTQYPGCLVFFRGSSESRTRLYRIAISRNYAELSHGFKIFGYINGQAVPFYPTRQFDGFIVQRRLNL